MSYSSIADYRLTLTEEQIWWFDHVRDYVLQKYPTLSFTLSYQRPMFKIKPKLFLMLGGGKNHFSIYTTDFDYVNTWKEKKIPGLKFGKSAVLFPLNKKEMITLAYQMCDEVIYRAN
ncbi:MAG: hypothetical protein C4537_01955 [Acholeplasma sp.]|jgi:uncharacterized protein YdhG (YjbR/CyaY superfamily)|nr:MAG: hypothetical protein C4537_01955 [Acholeplasma sp.]